MLRPYLTKTVIVVVCSISSVELHGTNRWYTQRSFETVAVADVKHEAIFYTKDTLTLYVLYFVVFRDLSSNLLKFIPQNTFRNLKSLSVM